MNIEGAAVILEYGVLGTGTFYLKGEMKVPGREKAKAHLEKFARGEGFTGIVLRGDPEGMMMGRGESEFSFLVFRGKTPDRGMLLRLFEKDGAPNILEPKNKVGRRVWAGDRHIDIFAS